MKQKYVYNKFTHSNLFQSKNKIYVKQGHVEIKSKQTNSNFVIHKQSPLTNTFVTYLNQTHKFLYMYSNAILYLFQIVCDSDLLIRDLECRFPGSTRQLCVG